MLVANEDLVEIRRLIEDESVDLNAVNEDAFCYINGCFLHGFQGNLFGFLFDFYCVERGRPLIEVEKYLEKALVIWALMKCEGHRKKAARLLGIGYCTILRKIKKYGICC